MSTADRSNDDGARSLVNKFVWGGGAAILVAEVPYLRCILYLVCGTTQLYRLYVRDHLRCQAMRLKNRPS